jgi:hypothetical protein
VEGPERYLRSASSWSEHGAVGTQLRPKPGQQRVNTHVARAEGDKKGRK